VYSAELGGVACPDCRREAPRALAVEAGTFRVLRFLQSRPLDEARRLELSPATQRGLEAVLLAQLHHVLERSLRSAELLDSVRRAGFGAAAVAPAASPE
jgi:DNA repair protein RecO (recombination protein O)